MKKDLFACSLRVLVALAVSCQFFSCATKDALSDDVIASGPSSVSGTSGQDGASSGDPLSEDPSADGPSGGSSDQPALPDDPYPHIPLESLDMVTVSCQGESNGEASQPQSKATSTGEQPDELDPSFVPVQWDAESTKTYLDASNNIFWSEGDRLKIYYADGASNYTVSTIKHGDVQKSTFDALVDKSADYYYAFYPEGLTATMTDIAAKGAFEIVIPSEQDGRFENCHLAVGKASAEGRHFAFKNVGSYMKITVASTSATAITLQATNSEDKIVGTLVAPFTDDAGTLGELTLKEGTGASSVTVNLPEGRTGATTVYIALLPGVNFSKGFRLRYEYADGQTRPGYAYSKSDGRSIARRGILNVKTLDDRIKTDWFVKTSGTYSDADASGAGSSWDKALNVTGLADLLAQPLDGSGNQDDYAAFDRAWMLDGAHIHIAAGEYTLDKVKMECTNYDHPFSVHILGGYPTSLSDTATSAVRDTTANRTTFVGAGDRILLLGNQVSLTMDKVWMTGGRSRGNSESGVALQVHPGTTGQARAVLTACGFKDNVTSGTDSNGGAVSVHGNKAYARLDGCHFYGNATGPGQAAGAIYVWSDDAGAEVHVNGCTFIANAAGTWGGAIGCSKGKVFINQEVNTTATVFRNNCTKNSDSHGGAVYCATGALCARNCRFVGNWCPSGANLGAGGGLSLADDCTTSLSDLHFSADESGRYMARNGGFLRINTDILHPVTFSNCTFENGKPSNVGGVVVLTTGAESDLRFEKCRFTDNISNYAGGVCHLNTTTHKASFTSCTFTGNQVTGSGGGGVLSMEAGTATLTSCTFTGNRQTAASARGGGVFWLHSSKNPRLTVRGCTFEDNTASVTTAGDAAGNQTCGGGILYADNGTVTFTSSDEMASGTRNSVSGSASATAGGAILAVKGSNAMSLSFAYTDFSSNASANYGGGVYTDTDVTLTDCILDGNTASTGAAALYAGGNITVAGSDTLKCAIRNHSNTGNSPIMYAAAGSISLTGCKIQGNSVVSPSSRGGLFPLTNNAFTATDCVFRSNSVSGGGSRYGVVAGLLAGGSGTLTLNNTDIYFCNGTQNAGAIYVEGGVKAASGTAVTVTGGRFKGNVTDGYGGVFHFEETAANAVRAVFSGAVFEANEASTRGGAFHLNNEAIGRNVSITDCTFTRNVQTSTDSGRGGGAINLEAGALTLSGCNFTANESKSVPAADNNWSGGGVIMTSGLATLTLTIQASEANGRPVLSGNKSAGYGGAISHTNGSDKSVCSIRDTKFTSNTSVFSGGALYYKTSNALSLTDVGFVRNSVTGSGASFDAAHAGDAIAYINGKSLTMTGSKMSLNYIEGHTATVPIHSPAVTTYTFDKIEFKSNTTTLRNGSMLNLNTKATFAISNSSIHDNSAPHGGAIFADLPRYTDITTGTGNCTISNTSLENNTATAADGKGGAIYWNCVSWTNNVESGTPMLKINKSSRLNGNKATMAGSAIWLGVGRVYLDACTVSGNTFASLTSSEANDHGGTLYMESLYSKLDITNCTLSGNSVDGKGGVLNVQAGRVFMTNCTCNGNSAYSRGGAIFHSSGGFILVRRSTFVGNYVTKNNAWGSFLHVNNGGSYSMFLNCTIDDGPTARTTATVNGSVNLMLVNSTVIGNTSGPVLRVENNKNGLLLNNIILNRGSGKAVFHYGGYNWSSYGGYNILGSVERNGQTVTNIPGECTGDKTGKTEASLGSWLWNDAGYYTWDGKVGGVATATPAINPSGKDDYVSSGMKSGFNYSLTINDEKDLNAIVNNLGNQVVTGWASGEYYFDRRGNSSAGDRRVAGHNYPGSYAL